MNRIFKRSLLLAATVGIASCNAFDLSGPKLDEDPNIQLRALRTEQYFVGIHGAQAFFQEGNATRTVCMWLQHCAGVDRQYSSYDTYAVSESDFDDDWGFVYAQGGLKDIRNMRALAIETLDERSEGISQIWEALTIGTAAGLWGDIPYSEVLDDEIPTPRLDPQLEIYDQLQIVLDSAIVNVQGGGLGISASADLIYSGNLTAWREAAWTLKARYHMATAEVRGAAAYTAARAAALNGISTPGNDFKFYHSDVDAEQNIWWQFMLVERDSYLRGSATLIDTLIGRGDPRLGIDFDALVNDGDYIPVDCSSEHEWCAGYFDWIEGSRPGENFGGAAFLSGTRFGGWEEYDGDFRQPIITWAENQLILAEAEFRLANPGVALGYLNAVRTASDRAPLGAATLREIGVEQWLTLFQNIEVWNYWRRNCEPQLTPAPGRTVIPGRLLYPVVERNANPNVPAPSAQQPRNPNDPAAC